MRNIDDGYYLTVVKNRETGEFERYLSLLEPTAAFTSGLPIEAIVGKVTGDCEDLDPEHFLPNPRFFEVLHHILARSAPDNPDLVAAAKSQGEGYVYIIDARTPTPMGDVPAHDIIGWVEVHAGSVGAYSGNPTYQVLTTDGLLQLDAFFRNRLVEEVKRLAAG